MSPAGEERMKRRSVFGTLGVEFIAVLVVAAFAQPDALQSLFKESRALADAGKFDEAVANYNKILVDVPKCSQCYIGIGDAYVKKGSMDEAEAAFKKSTEIDPQSAEGYTSLANLYNA